MRYELVRLFWPMHWATMAQNWGTVPVTSVDDWQIVWREPINSIYPVLGVNKDGGFPHKKILTPRGLAWVSVECTEIVRKAE